MIKEYRRLTKIEDRDRYAAWDLETDGLGGKVLGASFCLEDGEPGFIKGTSVDIIASVVDQFELHPIYRWYAHNAQYDWRYLFNEFDLRNYHYDLIMRTDNDVFMIVCTTSEGVTFKLADSFAFYNKSLKALLKTFAPNLPKLDLNFEHETFDPENIAHVRYAKRDAQGLVTALVNLDAKLVKLFSTRLGYTVASTAVRAWRHTLTKSQRFYNNFEDEPFIRSAYFGGLVFLTDTLQHENLVTMDINSSYPHVMRTLGVPYGEKVQRHSIAWDLPGIYRIQVYAPESIRIPILPLREGHRVIWPRGEFETVVTREEIQFAIAHGYEIVKVYEGISWGKMIFPFTDFVNKIESMRVEYKDAPEEDLAKLMQNSLYGKFGTRRERRKIFHPNSAEECVDATPWGIDGRFWFKVEYVEDLLCMPQWAVYITAQARLALLRQAYRVGVDKVIYGDTDSLTVPSKCATQFSQGSDYGAWKIAHSWAQFRAIAPKVYVGIEDEKWSGAIKGIPKKLMQNEKINLWPELFAGERLKVKIETLPKFVQFLKRERWGTYTQGRKSSLLSNSASWIEKLNGQVWPKIIGELEDERTNVVRVNFSG